MNNQYKTGLQRFYERYPDYKPYSRQTKPLGFVETASQSIDMAMTETTRVNSCKDKTADTLNLEIGVGAMCQEDLGRLKEIENNLNFKK
jgi:hypothetical protein